MSVEVPWWLTPLLIGGTFLAMFAIETLSPLRRVVEPKLRRTARNLGAAGISLAVLTWIQTPIVLPLSRWIVEHRVGLLRNLPFSAPLRVALGVLLLDYTLWFWHWVNHRVPFFWRFHLVHHIDRDLDASTALRFHFGELALSVGYRALQVVVIGADPAALWIWQTMLFVSILFHHSNTRLPIGFERLLVRFVVTPRMHGIHHSDRKNETDSNWSSLLSVWDTLHGTMVLNVPQREVEIGVPAYQEPSRVTLGRMLALPFRPQADDWLSPSGRSAIRVHDPETLRKLEA